ncbi:MAG: pectate lyase, partial [Alistipes sp.]|nr:pectate lyase [Alistipes sp.]
VDERYVDDALNGTATYTDGGNGSKNGLIDTQTAVGGWPTLTATAEEVARATTDSDGDHIPDYYETLLGLNPSKADATEKTLDPQGLYSNFEIYLHFLVKEITAGQTVGGTYTKLD